jgi:hypothetical protein
MTDVDELSKREHLWRAWGHLKAASYRETTLSTLSHYGQAWRYVGNIVERADHTEIDWEDV